MFAFYKNQFKRHREFPDKFSQGLKETISKIYHMFKSVHQIYVKLESNFLVRDLEDSQSEDSESSDEAGKEFDSMSSHESDEECKHGHD
jgi:hypothetical protein